MIDTNFNTLGTFFLISGSFSWVPDFIPSLQLLKWLADFSQSLFVARETNYYESQEAELWFLQVDYVLLMFDFLFDCSPDNWSALFQAPNENQKIYENFTVTNMDHCYFQDSIYWVV